MKKFAIGVISGMILSFTTGVIAASSEVKAILFPSTIQIHQDNEISTLKGNNNILNYEGSIYIPLRSFAENMGSTVSYSPPNSEPGSLPLVDIYTSAASWKSIWMSQGNLPTAPLSLKIDTISKGNTPQSNAVGIFAELYNTKEDTLLISKVAMKIKVEKIEEGSSPELVWTGTVHSPSQNSSGEWIPGNHSNMVWGIRSPVLFWDQKDNEGNPVSPGQYQISLTNSATIEYSTAFATETSGGSQVIDSDLSNTIMVYIQ